MRPQKLTARRTLLSSFALILLCQFSYSQEWLKEINHALDLAARVSAEKQMTLTAYQHLGAVDGEKEKLAVLDEIFADDAVTVVNSSDVFSIVEWGDSRAFTSEDREKFKKRVYNAIAREPIEVVELSWAYRDRDYKSKALVGHDGIVYDNIASFAIDYSANAENKETSAKITRPIPDEFFGVIPPNIANDKRGATFVMNEYVDGKLLLTGKYAWRYKYQFISAFDSNGILCNMSSKSGCKSQIGWQCSLGSEFIAGEINKSAYNEYQLEWKCYDERGGGSAFSRTRIQRP